MTVQNDAIAVKTGVGFAPAVIKKEDRHFADGFNFYKLFWIFTFGSIIGFIVETLWCLARYSALEWRGSMIIGPFNVVYGIGALALYLALYKVNKRKESHVFIVGVITGTVVEFLCSYVQEAAFGSVSWDYSAAPLNIGGRVCLIYSVFWGVLALLWCYWLQPCFEKLIAKIPNSFGKTLTWCLFAFLCFDAFISIASVVRWTMRLDGFPEVPWSILDRLLPNAKMESIYANMTFLK